MPKNRLPDKILAQFAMAENMADGAAAHGVAIGLLQNTEARIRAELAAAEAAYEAYGMARQARIEATAAQGVADDNGRNFFTAAKNVLMLVLGGEWSAAWVPVGFVSSLTIPKSISERMILLALLRNYFTSHPEREVAALNVTAAQAAALHTALSNAHSAANAAVTAVGQSRVVWENARRTLVRRMRGLIDELGQLIEADDSRWYAFGLTPPATDTTPAAPDGLILSLGPDDTILADWDNVPNANHYRVHVQVVGVDPEFVAQPTSFADSHATLGPFQPGQTVRVKVTAVSGGLEGPASDVAEVTMANGGGGGGDELTPPGQPTLEALVDGQVRVTFVAPPAGQFVKIYRQVMGQELDYQFAGNVLVPPAILTSLPPGETVRVRLTAATATDESEPGPYADIVTIA